MVRGTIIVTCPHYGKTFVAPDIEWGATIYSAPVHCPDCGQLVDPQGWKGLLGIIRGWFRKTKRIEQRTQKLTRHENNPFS